MKEQDHIASFVRSKLAEKTFPYQEAYWEGAQAQFAEWDRKKKRRRGFLWFFFGLLFVGTGGFVWGEMVGSDEQLSLRRQILDSPLYQTLYVPQENASPTSSSLTTVFNTAQSSGRATADVQPLSSSVSARVLSHPLQQELLQEDVLLPNRPVLFLSHSSSASSFSKRIKLNDLNSIQGLPLLLFPVHQPSVSSQVLPAPTPRKIRPYVRIGGNFTPSQVDEEKRNWQSNPDLEVGMEIPLGSRWQAQAGLSYFSSSLSNVSAMLRYRSYDFIFREQQLLWTPKSLQYAGVAVGLSHSILPRHEFGLGTRISYLLNTQGTVQESFASSFTESANEPEPANGYRNGLPDWDLQIRFWHQYALNRRLSIQTDGRLGIRNLTKAEIFTSPTPKRNTQLSVSLIYWLKK